MKYKSLLFLVMIAGAVSYILWGRATPASAEAMARCRITVPQSWGEFVGASDSFGLIFKDSAGTLRLVRQLPCGLDGTPSVAIEVQRN